MNIDNFSVYTIASVLKKFLRKLPGGIFGPEIEAKLFDIIQWDSVELKRDEIHRLVARLTKTTIPKCSKPWLTLHILFPPFK